MAKKISKKEAQLRFLKHVCGMVHYWSTVQHDNVKDTQDRVSGVAFSILAAIDGSSMAVPGYVLIPDPHPEDEAFHKANDEDWYAKASIRGDIAGDLHGQFHEVLRSVLKP